MKIILKFVLPEQAEGILFNWDLSDLCLGVLLTDATSDWLLFNELHDEGDRLNSRIKNFPNVE